MAQYKFSAGNTHGKGRPSTLIAKGIARDEANPPKVRLAAATTIIDIALFKTGWEDIDGGESLSDAATRMIIDMMALIRPLHVDFVERKHGVVSSAATITYAAPQEATSDRLEPMPTGGGYLA
jgi:hypothetical protein